MIYEVINYQTLRRSVDEFCAFLLEVGVPVDKIFDSKLAAYELLGNVLKHSEGGAKFSGGVVGEFVELKITAKKVFCAPEKGECSSVHSEHGRGLFLVDKICEERVLTEDGDLLIKIKICK